MLLYKGLVLALIFTVVNCGLLDVIKKGHETASDQARKAVKVPGHIADGVFEGAKTIKDGVAGTYSDELYAIYSGVALSAKEVTTHPVKDSDVTYFLCTNNNPNGTLVNSTVNFDKISTDHKLVFIIHGWTGSRNVTWYQNLTNAFLSRKDDKYQVIQVDWKGQAANLYTVASYVTQDIGEKIADFIVTIINKRKLPLSNVLVVGHSLGGQITGFIGKNIKTKLGQPLDRIVALDPAGPLFSTRPAEKRLTLTDAKVVHVIHTDGGKLGYQDAVGTIDFFPNGGSDQTGCARIDPSDVKTIVDPISCDHVRAPLLFIEAVKNHDFFKSVKCDTWRNFNKETKECQTQDTAIMGDLRSTKTGKYFLKTNSESPYSERY